MYKYLNRKPSSISLIYDLRTTVHNFYYTTKFKTFINLSFSGKWWTAKDITELVAPSIEISQKISSFLINAGATKVEDHRDMIKFTGSVSIVEQLLKTTLFNFQHNQSM